MTNHRLLILALSLSYGLELTMGLVHTPRVIASAAKGFFRGRTSTRVSGFSLDEPHIYIARAGLFDVDYLGHMNNASYLTHAEYARWQWIAETGVLGEFIRKKDAFIVTSTVVRYRREVKPLFRKFEVHTSLCGVDERTLSMYQTFRYPGQGGKNKIRAQVLLQAVIRRGEQGVIDPRDFLRDCVGMDPDKIDSLSKSGTTMEDELLKFKELESSLRETAAEDDKRVDQN